MWRSPDREVQPRSRIHGGWGGGGSTEPDQTQSRPEQALAPAVRNCPQSGKFWSEIAEDSLPCMQKCKWAFFHLKKAQARGQPFLSRTAGCRIMKTGCCLGEDKVNERYDTFVNSSNTAWFQEPADTGAADKASSWWQAFPLPPLNLTQTLILICQTRSLRKTNWRRRYAAGPARKVGGMILTPFFPSFSPLTCESTDMWHLNMLPSLLVCLNRSFVFVGSCGSALKEELPLSGQDDHFGPKFYYDKAKSFFDNISSDMKFRWSYRVWFEVIFPEYIVP